MSLNLVDLKLDRNKLNPKFDEYKLSLDNIPCYKLSLEFKPEYIQLSDKQFSLQHVKAFGNQNTLYHDPWISNVVYFIDERWKIMKFRVSQESKLEDPKPLLQIPGAKERGMNTERIAANLSFASPEWAFLSDGSGKLYILDTFNREEDLMWKICHTCTPVEEGTPFRLLHAMSRVEGGGVQILDCVLVHIESSQQSSEHTANNKSLFTSVLEWLTFRQVEGTDDQAFELKRVRRLEGKANADFCAILPGGGSLDIASERPFTMVYDSVNPVITEDSKPKKEGEEADFEEVTAPKEDACYHWTQTDEDVTLFISLPPNTCKSDIHVTFKQTQVKVTLNSGQVVLEGRPHSDIDPDECTWVVTNEEIKSSVGEFVKPDQLRLEVILAKKGSEKWVGGLKDCERKGVFVMDEKQLADMKEGLDHLTSDQMNADPDEEMQPAYNVEELESCDMYPDQSAVLMRCDGETHRTTHQVNLGSHQWLFNVSPGDTRTPCLCLRHDVDGIVWQPNLLDNDDPSQTPWAHLATFDAFGYVQASKQQRKFTACAPDFSYALVCDSVRHMYLYRQPTPTETDLRNRKTGRKVNAVAKQQLVSLESVDSVTGLFAAKDRIFAVAGDTMHILRVA